MNKIMLSPVLLAILATSAYAVDAPITNNTATDTTTTNSVVALPPAPTPGAQPTNTAAAPAPATTPTIDCNLHIPSNQTTIDPTLITTWASKAALQSFNFSPATIDTQLEALKACYTEAGWKGFNDALQKSGNISSIKSQQLNVSSQTDGTATINTVKDNQWKIVLPVEVVYQNDKEKVTQHLNVEVLVGRKATGDLGVMQMIATARPVEAATTTTPTTPLPTNESQNSAAPAQESTPTTDSGSQNPDTPIAPSEQPPLSNTIDQNNTAVESNEKNQ